MDIRDAHLQPLHEAFCITQGYINQMLLHCFLLLSGHRACTGPGPKGSSLSRLALHLINLYGGLSLPSVSVKVQALDAGLGSACTQLWHRFWGFFVSFVLACYLHRWLQRAKLLHFAFLSVLDAVCILWHIHPTLVLLCNKTSAVKICRLVHHFTLLETNWNQHENLCNTSNSIIITVMW